MCFRGEEKRDLSRDGKAVEVNTGQLYFESLRVMVDAMIAKTKISRTRHRKI
jgi:hypothetical protein